VFFTSAAQRDAAVTALRAAFGAQLALIWTIDVEDEGWARRSQADLKAVRVGRITVAPPWDASSPEHRVPSPEPRNPDLVLVIDPSTGFGTGHHETTRLCLTLLQDLDMSGRRTIDVGTGSGVLAIAASMLGAGSVVAVDIDAEALENARDNIDRNVRGAAIDLLEADVATLSIEPADIVTANLTAAVLERNAEALTRLAREGGSLIVSGFGPDEIEAVTGSLPALAVTRQVTEGAWVALQLRR
jgi:ribosomal protein L11 methyltransferase